jgi:pyruvate formate lyase activating enzyme
MRTESPSSSGEVGRWQHTLLDGRIECNLCPRNCRLREGQRGFCYVRQRVGDAIRLVSYGRTTGFCVDPIEKKPLNHFFPGSSVLSFGTVGCNLHCKFCQNWTMTRARRADRGAEVATPAEIAEAALRAGCRSVAFTYNDPVIFAEFAIDTAQECHARGLKTVAVTAGYISPAARREFFAVMDAANVDLKAFSPDFYRRFCSGRLEPVLDTLRYLAQETSVWLEVTNLLVPQANDSPAEVDRLTEWMVSELGRDVPLHFSAFHPDYQVRHLPHTPSETCRRAREQALGKGLRHVYTGNLHDPRGQSTYCPGCGAMVIERDGYKLGTWGLEADRCRRCGTAVAGRFAPDGPEACGPRRRRLVVG